MKIENDIIEAGKRLNSFVDRGVYLITGSTGMMGRYIVRILSKIDGVRIIAGCRSKEKAHQLYSDLIEKKIVSVKEFDVCNDNWEIEEKIDYILHAAGICENNYLKRFPQEVIRNHVLGAYQTMEFAKKKDVKKLVVFSSASIYGKADLKKERFKESEIGFIDFSDYRNAYGVSKRTVENLCSGYSDKIQITIIRPFHMICPEQVLIKSSMLGEFYSKIVDGEDIIINGNGEPIRNFTYIVDMCEMILMLLKCSPGVYNLGNPKGDLSVMETAKIIKDVSQSFNRNISNVRIILGGNYQKPSNSENMVPELEKVNKELSKKDYLINYISPREAIEKSLAEIMVND